MEYNIVADEHTLTVSIHVPQADSAADIDCEFECDDGTAEIVFSCSGQQQRIPLAPSAGHRCGSPTSASWD